MTHRREFWDFYTSARCALERCHCLRSSGDILRPPPGNGHPASIPLQGKPRVHPRVSQVHIYPLTVVWRVCMPLRRLLSRICGHKHTIPVTPYFPPSCTRIVFLRLSRGVNVEGGVGPIATDGTRAGTSAGPQGAHANGE